MTQQRLREVRTDSLRTEPRGSKHGLGEQSLGGDDGWRPPKGLAPAAAAEIAQTSGSLSQPPQDLYGISARMRLWLN